MQIKRKYHSNIGQYMPLLSSFLIHSKDYINIDIKILHQYL